MKSGRNEMRIQRFLPSLPNFDPDIQGGAGGRTHGLVDFDIDVPPFCPAIQPIQPYSHLPKQS